MNGTTAEHEQEVARLRDALATERAALDQRAADVEAAENAAEEVPKIEAAARLDEIEREEADERKAKLAGAVDDARTALEESEAVVEEIARRVEAAGNAWAEAVEAEAAEPVSAADRRIAALSAQLAAAQAAREAPAASLREAKKRAQEIYDQTRETRSGKWYLRERQQRDREQHRWHEQHRQTVELMNSIGANRGLPRVSK
jgi:colicin import membrane protein